MIIRKEEIYDNFCCEGDDEWLVNKIEYYDNIVKVM